MTAGGVNYQKRAVGYSVFDGYLPWRFKCMGPNCDTELLLNFVIAETTQAFKAKVGEIEIGKMMSYTIPTIIIEFGKSESAVRKRRICT